MSAAIMLLLALLGPAQAFPTIFVARYANGCTEHPSADFGKVHEYSKTVDKDAAFSLTTADGKAAGGSVCAGDSYNLQVTFTAMPVRNYLLTSTHGSLTADNNDCDAWCENRVCSKRPVPQGKAEFKLPCDTPAGTQVTIKVTSANGRTPTPGSTLRSNTLSLLVGGPCPGKCGGSSSKSSSSVSTASEGSGSSSSGVSTSPKKVAQKTQP